MPDDLLPQPKVTPETNAISVEYLLGELTGISESQRDLSEQTLQRVNVHIALVTGSVALIVFIGSGLAPNAKLLFSLTVLLLISVLSLGLVVYADLVTWVIASAKMHRRAARIRRFFHDQDARLDYYAGRHFDDRPILVERRSFDALISTQLGPKQIVTLLNNVVAGVAGSCLVLALNPTRLGLASVVGIVVFLSVWGGQYSYARLRYRIEEEAERQNIHFPRPDSTD